MASAAAVSVEAEWADAAGEDDDFQELHEAIASGKAQRFGGGGPNPEGETAIDFTGENLPSRDSEIRIFWIVLFSVRRVVSEACRRSNYNKLLPSYFYHVHRASVQVPGFKLPFVDFDSGVPHHDNSAIFPPCLT